MKKRLLALFVCIGMLIGMPKAGATISLLGDANCDGEVTAADASLVLRYTVGLSELSAQGKENADVFPDFDGEPNAADAAAILRHLVRLIDLEEAFETPTPGATAGPSATPMPEINIDPELLKYIRIGCTMSKDWSAYAEDITRFIQSLPTSNPYRAILYQGALYMGTAYVSGESDCSGFVRSVYRDCGYQRDVYPSGGSNNVIVEFKSRLPQRIHDVTYRYGEADTSAWKPGYVLAYVDSQGTGNHVSIYLGCVDGVHFVMESAQGAGGVCIRELWEWGDYHLRYYINPLD